MSDFEKAIDYFAKYGNVSTDTEKLKRLWPACTAAQLRACATYAIDISQRPQVEVNIHLLSLIWGK